jgi:hypothetical protein
MVDEDRAGVADDIESTLRGFDIEQLDGRPPQRFSTKRCSRFSTT